MLKRWLCRVLLLPVAVMPVHADWEFPRLSVRNPDPAAMDSAFECQVRQFMDAHADRLQGVEAVVTRFGNTILITGQAEDAGERARLEQLVLDAAGISRQQQGSPVVVPARTQGCEGKALASNSKRKLIVKAGRDCSSLRVDRDMQAPATGRVFNHITVAVPDPVRQRAGAALLAAQASMSLIEAGVINAMDRRLVRLVAQGDVMYVLGRLEPARQAEIRTVLMTVAGIDDVRFYNE